MRYKIVTESSVWGLETTVNELFEKGYEPLGEPRYVERFCYWYQALYIPPTKNHTGPK